MSNRKICIARDVRGLDVFGRVLSTTLSAGDIVECRDAAQYPRFQPQAGHVLCYVFADGCLRWVPEDAIEEA